MDIIKELVTSTGVHKYCSRCETLYPKTPKSASVCVSCYHKGHYRKDKAKRLAQNATWRKANPDKVSAQRWREHRKYRYGLNQEAFMKIYNEQQGSCAICKKKAPPTSIRGLHVDHDPITGKNRQLLCGNCNAGLGQFKDSLKFLKEAMDYLERHSNAY